jgi:hypothetical protein
LFHPEIDQNVLHDLHDIFGNKSENQNGDDHDHAAEADGPLGCVFALSLLLFGEDVAVGAEREEKTWLG